MKRVKLGHCLDAEASGTCVNHNLPVFCPDVPHLKPRDRSVQHVQTLAGEVLANCDFLAFQLPLRLEDLSTFPITNKLNYNWPVFSSKFATDSMAPINVI